MTQSRDEQVYDVVRLIRRLNRTLASVADDYLEEAGLSSAERAVMEYLYPAASLSVPEIAARHDVSRQHVQVTLNGLLARGLVRSTPNPRHKRSPLFSLGDIGRDTFAGMSDNETRLITLLFSRVDETALDITRRTLASIHKRIS